MGNSSKKGGDSLGLGIMGSEAARLMRRCAIWINRYRAE
jgi:hypothetical protein